MVSGDDAKLKLKVLTSVQTCPVAVLVTVMVIVTVGLHPIIVFSVKVFPVAVSGVPQVDDHETDVIDHPPKTCEVLFITIVLLPFNPQETLLLKSALTGTCVVDAIVNVHPLQVMLAVTP